MSKGFRLSWNYIHPKKKKKTFGLLKHILKTHLGRFVNMEHCENRTKTTDKFNRPDAPRAHGIMCFNTSMGEKRYP